MVNQGARLSSLATQTQDRRRGPAVLPSRPGASLVVDLLEVFIEPAVERISEMTRLPSGWDGEDALPPTGPAVAGACHVIVAVAERSRRAGRQTVAPWTSAPIADGGLQVEWLGSGARIEVQVGPDERFGYLLKRGNGAAARYDEADDVDFEAIVEKITNLVAS